MTAAWDWPCRTTRAAANRRASSAALRRAPRCGVVMPQHRMVLDEIHHFISRDSLDSQQALQLGLVEALNDLVVHHDDRNGHLSRELDQLLTRLRIGEYVDVLECYPLRRKILFRRFAGASRRARIDRHPMVAHWLLLGRKL